MVQAKGADVRWVGGAVLIIIGVALLAAQWVPDVGRYATLVVGLALLALFLVTRNAGALIGGSIVTGIGAGIVLEGAFPDASGGWVPLGLGVGFLFIWFAGSLLRMPEARFWPLIPGGILVFVGLDAMGGAFGDLLRYAWPVALIALGLVVIVNGRHRQPPPLSVGGSTEPPAEPPTGQG